MLEPWVLPFFWSVVFFAAVGATAGAIYVAKKYDAAAFVSTICAGIFVLLLLVATVIFFPYNVKFVTWTEKEAVIAKVEFSTEASTNSNNREKGGLRMELSDGTVIFTDDFRLALPKAGERVTMFCKPDFVSGNIDRYRCKAPTGG